MKTHKVYLSNGVLVQAENEEQAIAKVVKAINDGRVKLVAFADETPILE